jgi:hypothetical protein
MTTRRLAWVLACVAPAAALPAACGGSVTTGPDNVGASGNDAGGNSGEAGGAASGGTAGTGGGPAGTGGGPAGTGGGPAGTGGGPAGTGGGPAGTGGGPGGAAGTACAPPPSCNWCGGTPRYDSNNCIVGYICKNGVDPCQTPPCTGTPSVCKPGEACGSDGLCWPAPVTCWNGGCSAGSNGSCQCDWKCSDGHAYRMDCKMQAGSTMCACFMDNTPTPSCGASGPLSCQPPGCCGFPH